MEGDGNNNDNLESGLWGLGVEIWRFDKKSTHGSWASRVETRRIHFVLSVNSTALINAQRNPEVKLGNEDGDRTFDFYWE